MPHPAAWLALHRAAEMNQVQSVTTLLAAGADPDAASSTGHTPRGLARARDAADVLGVLGVLSRR